MSQRSPSTRPQRGILGQSGGVSHETSYLVGSRSLYKSDWERKEMGHTTLLASLQMDFRRGLRLQPRWKTTVAHDITNVSLLVRELDFF